jgi:DNA polymerase-4
MSYVPGGENDGCPVRTIMLLDIDCFFASVEMARRPELRGRPLCIGGPRTARGIVSCPNYEARAYGVRTAMPLRTASRLLPPDAVFLPGNHRLYGEYSDRVMDLLETFTPDVEQVSIDEAYLDVTGCLHLWGDAGRMGSAIKEKIRSATGLSVSIGVAANKLCAKIGASIRKPDGLVIVPGGGEREFLAPLPVGAIPGIGVKSVPRLHARGIMTVGDLLASPWGREGALGRLLTTVADGRCSSTLHHGRVEHSISRDRTFGEDTVDRERIAATLYYLIERCCKTLRRRELCAQTVTVKVRSSRFLTLQKQLTLRVPTANEEEIFAVARPLLERLLPARERVRLVGIKASHLVPGGGEGSQMELAAAEKEKRGTLHQRVDVLQEKHGYRCIHWGITHPLHWELRRSDREDRNEREEGGRE